MASRCDGRASVRLLAPAAALDPRPGCRLWWFGESWAHFAHRRVGWDAWDQGAALQQAFAALADHLVNLDRHAFTGRLRALWDATLLAEPNPLASPLTVEAARMLALLRAAADGGEHVVVAEDAEFGHVLARALAAAGHSVDNRLPPPPGRAARALAVLRARLSGLRHDLVLWWRLRARRRAAGRPLRLDGFDTLMVLWVRAGSFPVGRDFFFGTVPDALRAQGRRLGFLGLPMGSERRAEAVEAVLAAAADEPTALLHDVAGPWDMVVAWLLPLLLPWVVRPRLTVEGCDLSAVLPLAVSRDLRSGHASFALLAGRGAARLLARAPVRRLVVLYENQAWEKAVRRAARAAPCRPRVIGFQHASFPPDYPSFFPAAADVAANLVPDRLLPMGPAYARRFTAHGFPAGRVRVAGAWRYGNFLAGLAQAVPGGRGSGVVLCGTGLALHPTIELVTKAMHALAGQPGVRLAVNFHPAADEEFRRGVREAVAGLAAPGMPAPTYLDCDIQTALMSADVLLYNVSGVALEAMALGIPCVFVASDLSLDLDTVPTGTAPARSVAGLAQAVASALTTRDETRAELARMVLGDHLAPPDPAALAWAAADDEKD